MNNSKILGAMKRALKNVKGYKNFEQIFISKNGNYVLTNKFYIIDYGTDKNNIPMILNEYIDLEKISCAFDYESMHNSNINGTEIIKVTDLEKLKKYNKNSENPLPYVINNEILINANYMLDILILSNFKGKEFEIEYGTHISPINIKLKDINSLLLPIKLDSKIQEKFIKKSKEILESEV